MKILYIIQNHLQWMSGCWFYRMQIPGKELKRQGHEIKSLIAGQEMDKEWAEWTDVAIFGRTYDINVEKLVKQFQSAGKKVIYDLDDDMWSVPAINHTATAIDLKKEEVGKLARLANVITTTTPTLKKELLKFNKNVVVCPNAIDLADYGEILPKGNKLKIVYSLSATHFKDFDIVLPVLKELQKKYDFEMIIQGICGQPLAAEFYTYNMLLKMGVMSDKQNIFYQAGINTIKQIYELKFQHIPFYPPELYPSILKQVNGDIGIAPLEDNKFNRSKSCCKFYEYAATGMATIASKVTPYQEEVDYCAKNTYSDWYKKLEKLIIDKNFREDLAKKQRRWVLNNRNIQKIVEENWLPILKVGKQINKTKQNEQF